MGRKALKMGSKMGSGLAFGYLSFDSLFFSLHIAIEGISEIGCGRFAAHKLAPIS